MNKDQKARAAMHEAVDGVLETHKAVWQTGNPGFVRTVAKYREKLAIEQDLVERQKPDRKGITADKNKIIADLIAALVPIAGAIRAYAIEHDDHELAAKMHFKPSKLKTEGDEALRADAENVAAAGRANLAALDDNAMDEDELDAFDLLVAKFKAAIPKPRTGTATVKDVTARLEEALDDTDAYLADVLDGRVSKYASVAPDFTGAYTNARIIVNFGGRSRKNNPPAPPPAG